MRNSEMTIPQGVTSEGMIAPYSVTCFPQTGSFNPPFTNPSANDGVDRVFALTSRPSVLSHRVGASTRSDLAYGIDNFDLPLQGFPINAPTSPLPCNFYGGYTGTNNTIVQQDVTYSAKDQPDASDQMMISNDIQPTVSEPNTQIGLATKPAAEPAPLRFSKSCKWEGCQYPRPFGRDADLVRHLKSVHINPGAYICPDLGCGKPFSRKDNLDAHRQRVHGGGT